MDARKGREGKRRRFVETPRSVCVEGERVGEQVVFRDLFLVRVGESVRVDGKAPRLRSRKYFWIVALNGRFVVRKGKDTRRRDSVQDFKRGKEEDLGLGN